MGANSSITLSNGTYLIFAIKPQWKKQAIFSVDKTYGIAEMPRVHQMPTDFEYSKLREDVKAFVGSCLQGQKEDSFGAKVEAFEVVSLAYDGNEKFLLSLYYGNKQTKTIIYDTTEYAVGLERQYVRIDEIAEADISDIEGAVSGC